MRKTEGRELRAERALAGLRAREASAALSRGEPDLTLFSEDPPTCHGEVQDKSRSREACREAAAVT